MWSAYTLRFLWGVSELGLLEGGVMSEEVGGGMLG